MATVTYNTSFIARVALTAGRQSAHNSKDTESASGLTQWSMTHSVSGHTHSMVYGPQCFRTHSQQFMTQFSAHMV